MPPPCTHPPPNTHCTVLLALQGINEMQAAGNLLGGTSGGVQLQYAIVDRALVHLKALVEGYVGHVNGLIDRSGVPLPAVPLEADLDAASLMDRSVSLVGRQLPRRDLRDREPVGRCVACDGGSRGGRWW